MALAKLWFGRCQSQERVAQAPYPSNQKREFSARSMSVPCFVHAHDDSFIVPSSTRIVVIQPLALEIPLPRGLRP